MGCIPEDADIFRGEILWPEENPVNGPYNKYQEMLWRDYIQCLDAYVQDKSFRKMAVKAYATYKRAVISYEKKMGIQ